MAGRVERGDDPENGNGEYTRYDTAVNPTGQPGVSAMRHGVGGSPESRVEGGIWRVAYLVHADMDDMIVSPIFTAVRMRVGRRRVGIGSRDGESRKS